MASVPRARTIPVSSGRVSRTSLAVSRPLWLATGAMYAVFSASQGLLALLAEDPAPAGVWILVVWLAAASAVHLLTRPPAIGTIGNHVALTCVWASVTAAFVVAEPGGIAVGGVMFVAPLNSVRLQRRWEIVAHTCAASTAFFLVAAAGVFGSSAVDISTGLCAGLVAFATPVQVISCTAVLRAAEAQARELAAAVRRDPVTGVGNRRLFDEQLALELASQRATHSQLSVLLVDLDDFSTIEAEDRIAASELLHRVAEVLDHHAPRDSWVARVDGDEFAVLLPRTSGPVARCVAAAVEAAVAELGRPDARPLSCCTAIATAPDDATTNAQLQAVADHRIRDAKHRRPGHRPDAGTAASGS